MLSLKVADNDLSFLVDTGATFSTMQTLPKFSHLSKNTVEVVGFSGVPQTLPVTEPLKTKVGRQTVTHPFVISSSVPVNLMGRDLLIKLGATILCGPEGLVVTLPDGTTLNCAATSHMNGQWLLSETSEQMTDIYWGRLTTNTGILTRYLEWKPWILALDVYSPPVDPYHVTLFYDQGHTEWYQDVFDENLEGREWHIHTTGIYVGPQGVAALAELTQEQMVWYRMQDESVPHVSLALHPGHQAKDLGPMVKMAIRSTDWLQSQIPGVSYSPGCKTYRVEVAADDRVLLERKQVSRVHGREKMDHAEASEALSKLPDSL